MASVRIDMSEVESSAEQIQAFRRTWYRAVKGGITNAAKIYIVPQIKNRAAPSRYKGNVYAATQTAGADGFRIKFSVRGGQKVKSIVGILNFGGSLPRPIYPRRKLAVTPPGGPVAVVRGPAHISAKHFFEKGIEAGQGNFLMQVGKMVADRLEEAFD